MVIDKIRLEFKGHSIYAIGRKTADKKQEKVYFDIKFVVLERPPGQPEPGPFLWHENFLYTLPFEFYLPVALPTTYEHPSGYIRYLATALLSTDPADSDVCYSAKKPFTIIEPAPIRRTPIPTPEPVATSVTWKHKGCCTRGGAKITADVRLPKNCYAPGEAIYGTITINNRLSKKLSEILSVGLIDQVCLASDDSFLPANKDSIGDADVTTGESAPKFSVALKSPKKSTKNEPKGSSAPKFDHRVILNQTIDLEVLDLPKEIKSKESITYENIYFFTVPPVPPTLTGKTVLDKGRKYGSEFFLN